MSIGDNTQELEEVLEMARSLPERSASGGSEADLVIRVNNNGHTKILAGDIEIVKGDILSISESLLANNGECVKVEVHSYYYQSDGYAIECSVVNARAYLYAEWLQIYWIIPNTTTTYSHCGQWNINSGALDYISSARYQGTSM